MKTKKQNTETIVAQALQTPEGQQMFKNAMCHGYPTFQEALTNFYVPALIQQYRDKRNTAQ